jgi:hypothetical protein
VKIIGTLRTPVRQVIEEASSFIHVPTAAFCMVVKGEQDLPGLYFGEPIEAQARLRSSLARFTSSIPTGLTRRSSR